MKNESVSCLNILIVKQNNKKCHCSPFSVKLPFIDPQSFLLGDIQRRRGDRGGHIEGEEGLESSKEEEEG